MARVNITLPDELLEHARAAELNISRFAAAALSTALNQRSKLAWFDRYLAHLELLSGPVSATETAEAEAWAERALGPRPAPDAAQPHPAVVLDVAGITALAGRRGRLVALRDRLHTPARIPAVVLTEALAENLHDLDADQLVNLCEIHDVTEALAREGARLRMLTKRAGVISGTAAVVVAFAAEQAAAIVLTDRPKDLLELAERAQHPVTINAV